MSLLGSNVLAEDRDGRYTGFGKKIYKDKEITKLRKLVEGKPKSKRKSSKKKSRPTYIRYDPNARYSDEDDYYKSEDSNDDSDNGKDGFPNKHLSIIDTSRRRKVKGKGELSDMIEAGLSKKVSGKLDSIMKEEANNALSDGDIKKLLNGRTNIVMYEDLANVENIEDILEPYGTCILLYQHSDTFGHWVCLNYRKLKGGDKVIEFFDSYGGKPDDQLKYCTYIKEPYLTGLLEKTPFEVMWNPFQLQAKKEDISSCGRWAVLRCLLSYMPLAQFVKLFKDNPKKPDYYATLLTTLLTE